ncbi:diaminopimelate decarboxylase [Desulforamulus ruminis]|uniref:Diaminopimelate decarboxylase n=1 Tax=Desulforamulus ruminis (strain ATCC 23193 / DSM 2154 / NCIMB 8452 / DL) TaxID=696281 RepID=F6DT84_DESRL|nr:diaminopimelate decarboxylase [Desulforamulus ruminis]AEG61189.1 diaminopimelate decarboxylase [Desulforamulus ruminis DSM 2154]
MKLQGTMKVNKNGHLEIGGCDTVELAKRFGTPLYVIDEALFRQNCRAYYRAFTEEHGVEVIYASKTLSNLAVCHMVEQEGLGLDVVSGGELYTAATARFPMGRVYFHGNNKSTEELRLALEYKVGRIVVDNFYELERLNELAGEAQTRAKIILRLSPGVEAHTHEYIKTGQIDSKFGLVIENGSAMAGVKYCLELPHIELKGFHCHIGSQIFELDSYAHAAETMMDFIHTVYRETDYLAEELNLGGGLGIYYFNGDQPRPVKEYADVMMRALQERAASYDLPVPRVIVEPGRSISGPAGSTLYTVGAIKDIPGIRKYVAVDGGMGDNPRPALYQSKYEAYIANRMLEEVEEKVSIAGKCCESGDMLIWDIELPAPQAGDLLVVASTGAYNYSMSMNYNRLPRPAMVLVSEGKADVIVKREDYTDLIRNDVIPERLRSSVMKLASSR